MVEESIGLFLLDGCAARYSIGKKLCGSLHARDAFFIKLTRHHLRGRHFENCSDADDVVEPLGIELPHSVSSMGKQLDLPTLCKPLQRLSDS